MSGQSDSEKPRVLVIGVGNEHRGDDAFGLLVARALRSRVSASVHIIEHHGEGASLLEAWQGFPCVIIIDAIQSGTESEAPVRIDAIQTKIPTSLFHHSSHQFGVAEAIETARALKRLPERLLVFGAVAESFELGKSISKSMSLQVEQVAELIMAELDKLRVH